MRSRLGTLLVREGLLTPAQHLEAVEHSEDREQPLITSVLVLGYVSEDRLVDLFREQLLVPVASKEMLSSPAAAALAAVPAEMAREFLLCPCGADAEGSLLVAMADASDTHALDEVTYHSGRRVVRYVAAERAVRWAIGHHYGLDMGQPTPPWGAVPADEIVLLTKVKVPGRSARVPTSRAPAAAQTMTGPVQFAKTSRSAPASPGLPAGRERPTTPAGTGREAVSDRDERDAAGGRRRHGTLLGVPTRDVQGRLTDAAAYVEPPTAPGATDPSVQGKIVSERAARDLPGQPRDPQSGWPSGPAGLWSSGATRVDPGERSEALGQALSALRRAPHRDEVGRVVLAYFEGFYLDVVLLVVRQQRLVGWRGGGIKLHPDRIPAIDVALSEPSTLRNTVVSRLVYQGPLGCSPQDAMFVAQLGYVPESVLLVPVQVHKQVIGILYADSPHTRLPTGEVEVLLSEAELVYEALLSR